MKTIRSAFTRLGLLLTVVALGFFFLTGTASAQTQTLEMLGGYGTPGQTDPYTEYSLDNGVTWHQAYLTGWHPWMFVPGTNSWINCDPSPFVCLNQTVPYRIRFTLPEGWSNPQMQFHINADNIAHISMNGVPVATVAGNFGVPPSVFDQSVTDALRTGLNEIQITLIDQGGWVGINYKITITVDAPTPPVVVPVSDVTPPTIAASRTPAANGDGWNNTDVIVTFTCADDVQVGSCTDPVTLSSEGANQSATGVAVDAAGNTASTTVTGINIDKTAPTITYAGNNGTYTVDQTVDITCSASDDLSGVASSHCAPVLGAAHNFLLGTNSYSATATDKAGNETTSVASFTVTVSAQSLCALTKQFVTKDGVAVSLCAKLNAAAASQARGQLNAMSNQINAYGKEVQAQTGKSLTAAQAAILIQLASAL